MQRSRRLFSQGFLVLALVGALSASTATAQTPVDTGLAWLASHQNMNGTWGATPELMPRDTARALIAQSLLNRPTAAAPAGFAWLTSQSALGANQFIAEQALALALGKIDDTPALGQLVQQRSATGGDFGGFADNTGDSLDSALALEAFSTQNGLYAAQISTLVTALMTRQNPDGGWGIDAGFHSNTVMTAEVLMAFASLKAQQQPPLAVIQIAEQYLASQMHADGSIGTGVLETATAFRALALSGYPLGSTATTTLNYLSAQRAADGSWGSDAYLTSRVLEAFAANKPNLVIRQGDISITPSSLLDGANATASVKVTNTGSLASPSATVTLHLTDVNGRTLGTVGVGGLAPGASQTVTTSFAATTMVGQDTLFAIVDQANAVDELRKDDNSATVSFTVAGKPDLQVYAADISTTPAHVQPNQAATMNFIIRNNGDGDAANVSYSVLDGATQIAKATIASIVNGSSQTVSVAINLAAGSHTITVTADPDNTIAETNETNNAATKTIAVSPLSNLDLRIAQGAVTATPSGATAGQTVTITATVDNIGNTPAQTSVAFFDGDPSLGRAFSVVPVSLDAQTSQQVSATYVLASTTTAIYAMVDPQNLLAETDETNNAAYVTISNQYTDLVIQKDGLVLSSTQILSAGQQITVRAVVRNRGTVAANNAEVAIYDDLPQLGGKQLIDTFVNVPAGGKVVVSAPLTVRAGQRIATAIINATKSVTEIDYSNNEMTKLYAVKGNEADIALNTQIPRTQAIDTSGVTVDNVALTISGIARISIVGAAPRPFAVTIFDDVDGDLAFNPEVDVVLGTANALAGMAAQVIEVPLQGSLRYAPGHPVIYLDSGNAVAELNESNNLIDLWQDCQGNPPVSTGSFYKWRTNIQSSRQATVARLLDTNGDGVIDENDVPAIVTTVDGAVVVMRGDTGEVVWTRGTDGSGTNVVTVVADVDNDGIPDIIAHESNTTDHHLICLNNDGTTKWVSPDLDRDPWWDFVITLDGTYRYVGMPVVADLDGDGIPEVITGREVLSGVDGHKLWIGTGGSGRVWDDNDLGSYFSSADLEGPIAVDVIGDGKLEVIGGNTAYRPDGTILWSRGDLGDGLTAPVYPPNQTTPNICLVTFGHVYLLNGMTGATIWGPVPVPGGARFGGAPTVFMDGTTGPWVGVAGEGHYSVLNALTGAVRWSVPTTSAWDTGGVALTQNAATAFDFGAGERLAYSGQSVFFIFRASDGSVETRFPATDDTINLQPTSVNLAFPGAPTIADFDGDGHADIFIPDTTTGTGILTNTTWNAAPSIYNEASYHVVNVANDEAKVASPEVQTTFSRGNWRAQLQQPPGVAGHIPEPNLVASYPRLDPSHYPTSARLIVRIANNGWAAANPVPVAFYGVNASNASTLLGVTQSGPIPAGGYQDVVYVLPNPPLGGFSFYAVADKAADGTSTLTECNENDNVSPTFSTQFSADVAIDPSSVVASNTAPLPNTNIDLTASAKLTGTIDASVLKAQFFIGSPTGTPISTQLPVIITTNPDGSRSASITWTWNVNVAVGNYDVYVVFDPANVIAETDETNNSGHYAITVSSSLNADIATDNSLFVVSDPNPRPGDTIQIGTTAHISGTLDTSLLQVQFFNGDPRSGGTAISPVLTPKVTTSSNFTSASASYAWTVNVAEGNYVLYAVWDPANLIVETNESNNVATTALQVSTPQIIRKLSAAVTLTPPSSEAGQPVAIAAMVQNLGNATLDTGTINYTVTGGSGTGMTGSATITSLPKNQYVSLNLGTFTPATNGTYTVTLTTPDDTLTLIADTKTITIAPFAGAQLHVAPTSVPVSLPLIQMHTSISRTNTIVIPDDPLVPLIKAHLQSAVNWQESAMPAELNAGCYRCHVHAQGLAGFAATSLVSGVSVDQTLEAKTGNFIISQQNANGSWFTGNYVTSTTSAVWALSFWDPTVAQGPMTKGLNWLLGAMLNGPNGSGYYTCDECRISFAGSETVSMFAMVAYARGWEQTHDPNYQNAMARLTSWGLQYNYQATAATGPEFAARVAIGLAAMIPDLQDPLLQSAAKKRLQDIALFLRSQQNPDGSFGAQAPPPDYPVIRTSQSLYVLALAGASGTDPALRSAILWLINHQLPAGGWSENINEFTLPVHWWDETTWTMIALPAAFLRLGQFDVDYAVMLPSTSDLTSSSPPPSSITTVTGGKQLVWHLPNVTEAGEDVSFNVRLNGLQPAETRPASGAQSITFMHPYTGATESQNILVPSVTGFAPLNLAVSTDKPAYGPSTAVAITEAIANVGTTSDGITTDLAIRDANGLTVATLASGDPVQGLPPSAFPGWHYAIPVTAPITGAGTNRAIAIPIDFQAQLTALGVLGTFDPNSIRISSDDAPSSELYHSWLPGSVSTKGQLFVQIPDSIAVGSTFDGHIFFDVIDNGIKPLSLFQWSASTLGFNGIRARYGYLDTAHMNPNAPTPDGIVYTDPNVMSIVQPTTNISAPAPPRQEYWGTEWTGQLYVPTTGTYQFLLTADDGAWFYIDGNLIVSEPGLHPTYNVTGSATLTAGLHTIRGEMFNWCCVYSFNVQWAPPGQGFSAIPSGNLFQQIFASTNVALGTPMVLPNGTVTLTYPWNTGSTAAAPYTAVATLRQYGAFVNSVAAPFTILPATQIGASIATDKPAYDPGTTVHVTGAVTETSSNTPTTNLSASISILDPGGSVVAKSATPAAIPSLVPGQSVPLAFDWAIGSAAPAVYTAKVTVLDSTGSERAEASAPFTVRSTATSGKGISGTISAPDSINQGQTLQIATGITNVGNAALSNAPFAVQIIDPQTQSLVTTLDFQASPDAGQSVSTTVPYFVGTINPQTYTATLVSLITGQPVPLASTSFTVKIIPTIVTATIASDKPAYDVNDTVHATTQVQVQSAPVPLNNVSVAGTITNPNGVVVVTNNQTIARIAPGQTLPVSFDWNSGTNSPGTYTLAAVVSDANGKSLAQPSTTFVIRSTAVTGIGVSGTISAPAVVVQGDPLPITTTITDNGNADLVNAPFAVTIASDTLPFNASVAMTATTAQQLVEATGGLTPGTYTATLVSMITGSPVRLASTPVIVQVPTVVTATISTDKPAYDPGNTLTGTTAVTVVSAPAPLNNVVVAATITSPGGSVVATNTQTIATIAPGQTLPVSFPWNVGTNPPGTYTLSAVVTGANGKTFAQPSTTFVIRSTSVTGVGVTGTLTTLDSVVQGDPLPLTATITDSGNAALTNAPFAIQITSNTLPFTLSVPLGGSATTQLTFDTHSLSPAAYTATLVSMITGSPVPLATAPFTVKPPVTLTVTPSATPRVLIWSDCSAGNSGTPCTPVPPPFLTKTLTDAGIPWSIVGDEFSFITQLRTGGYNEVILDPPPVNEPKIAAELSETIHAHIGVLIIHDHPDAMPTLASALGISYRGNLNVTSTLLDILATPIAKSGQMTVAGDGVQIDLGTAKAAALISATQLPAISYNTFGAGRVVVLPFDAEKTPTPDMASFLLGVVAYVADVPGTDARSVAALDFAVSVPAGGSQTVTVNVALPQGMSIVSASPQLTTSDPPSWTITVPGGTTTHLTLRVRLPETIGSYDVTGTLVLAGQTLVTKTIALKVTADRTAIESSLASDLSALLAAAPASDQHFINDAQSQLAAIEAATPTDVAGAVAQVGRVLAIINDIQHISVDTSAARTDADRMLIYWQSRAGS